MRHFANLRAVPFAGPPPKGPIMRLPNTAPIRTPGPAGFLEWLLRESGPGGLMPGVYQHIRNHAPALITRGALHGFGQGLIDTAPTIQDVGVSDATSITPTWALAADQVAPDASGWADSIAKLVTPVITGVEQIKLFNTQLSLAQRGRPPLNTSQIRLPGVPVNVGVSVAGIPWWGWGALIGGALLLFGGGRRRR